jgi:lysozyme
MKKLKVSTWAAIVAAACMANSQVKAENIFGIDVSSYQGSVNWSTVHANGAVFAYAKATEGYDYYEDPDYKANMANGKAAGLEMGAYEYTHCWVNTPAQEATYFWNYASSEFGDGGQTIMPAIDLEVFKGVDGASTYTAWMNDWSADIKAKNTGWAIRPVIYISACNACYLNSSIALSPWIADYNGENLYTGGPWSTCKDCNVWDGGGTGDWTYWQVSSSGSIGGVSGDCDFDAYPDSLADLKAWQAILPN